LHAVSGMLPNHHSEVVLTLLQIEAEMEALFDFMQYVYGVFGLDFDLELSTRPLDNYLGSIETWDAAETVRDRLSLHFACPHDS
jgi:threonyl-tRNA synthetase